MKSHSDIKPLAILELGDGSYHYNHSIKEIEREGENGESEKSYEYHTVQIWGVPTYEKVVKAVIREEYDETQEFSLINKYNAHKMGISSNTDVENAYKEYLMKTMRIKEMVKKDLNQLKINRYGNHSSL